jgi:hypothetical protein
MPIPAIPSVVSEDKAARVTAEPVRVEWQYRGATCSVTVGCGTRYRPGVSMRLGALGLIDLFAPTYSLEDVSAIHDWLYRHREQHGLSRAEADAVLLADTGDPRWVRTAAWFVVRVLGWAVW